MALDMVDMRLTTQALAPFEVRKAPLSREAAGPTLGAALGPRRWGAPDRYIKISRAAQSQITEKRGPAYQARIKFADIECLTAVRRPDLGQSSHRSPGSHRQGPPPRLVQSWSASL